MSTDTTSDNVTLYYRQGSSDKVYQAAIEPSGHGFAVRFAFGRRGSALQAGTKTNGPVGYDEAKRIFDQLVREKTAKGYTPGPDGTPFRGTEQAGRVTGVLPQLLNPIEEADVDRLVADDEWWAQPKFDGRRVMILKQGSDVTGINRTGLTVALPAPIVAAVLSAQADRCLLDGELIGDVYHCFDLLSRDDANLRSEPYAARYDAALDLVDMVPHDALRYAETAATAVRKRKLIERLRRQDAEGVVFKNRLASYTHGRPSVGGPQLKLKFWASASCIAARPSPGKRSIELELFFAGARVPVGKVTVPANQPMPPAGAVVEVRYLYAYPGGSLYQPVYLGPRDDVPTCVCTRGQLKLKPRDSDEEP